MMKGVDIFMTVKELKEQIETIPDNTEICFKINVWDLEFDMSSADEGIVDDVQIIDSNDQFWKEYYRIDDEYCSSSEVLIIEGRSYQCLRAERD